MKSSGLPNFDDKITYADGDLLVHVRWQTVVHGPTLWVADEGIKWCRGHVDEHSEDGKALLAAALMEQKPKTSFQEEFRDHNRHYKTTYDGSGD